MSGADPPRTARPRSSSMATRSPSMPQEPTRSSTASPRPRRAGAAPGADRLGRGAVACRARHQARARRGDATPTLSFARSGHRIGGRSADPLGRSLWSLARRHLGPVRDAPAQIRCVADAHYRIAKRERGTAAPSPRSSVLTTRVRSWSSPRCSVADPATRRAGDGPGTLDRAAAWRGGPVGARAAEEARRVAAPTLESDDRRLPHLPRVERGLADATLTAYRSDLSDYRRVVPDGGSWATTPDTAVAYLATRMCRAPPADPSPREPSPTRGGPEGVLPLRLRRGPHRHRRRGPPLTSRRSGACPTPSTWGRRGAAAQAAPGGSARLARAAIRRRAAGSARRCASTARTSPSTGPSCASSARATRSASSR